MLRYETSSESGICGATGAGAEGPGAGVGLALLHGRDIGRILEDAVDGYETGG